MIIHKDQISILVVDDEPGMREMLSLELSSQGYHVVKSDNGAQGLTEIRQKKFSLMITDLKMPQMDGLELLERAKIIDPRLEIIMMTGHGSIGDAVEAMKMGAYDFILKPFQLVEINALIEKVLEKKELKMLLSLYQASNAIFSTMELDKMLEMTMDKLQNVLGADEGSIMLLNENKKLSIAASRGLSDEVAKQVQLEIGERVAGLVAKEKLGRLFVNGIEKYEEFSGIQGKPRVLSSILCPLIVQDELLGVLNLNRVTTSENFTAEDFQNASIFAAQVALAIQNAKLYSALQDAYRNLKQMQFDLVQSEKLASIGRLVAGVAHELNNPLTSVIGYSQMAQEIDDIDEIHRQLPIIHSQALRCSKIVKDLLFFARRQKVNSQAVDASVLLEDTLQGVSLELEKRKIKINKIYPSGSVLLYVDPHLLKQVFTNILSNAYQALEEIKTERLIEVKVELLSKKIRFSFKDNGPGISKEIIHKIFDPFYTTKEVGKGTGLGLSLSYGIIKEHDGTLTVDSCLGKETIFTIELPLKSIEEIVPVAAERSQDSTLKIPSGTRILLVEDETAIRNLMMKTFEEQDCKLDTASDGEAALEKLKKHDYDLILCDYRMPKLDGIQLFKEIQKLKPEITDHFLFVTGSTQFMRGFNSFFQENHLDVLLKPFTRNELIFSINTVIKKLKMKQGNHG